MRDDIRFIQQPLLDGQNFNIGDIVRLTTANLDNEYQLDVVILHREGKLIYGSVVVASPNVDIPVDRWEISRGDEVVFCQENIAKAILGAR